MITVLLIKGLIEMFKQINEKEWIDYCNYDLPNQNLLVKAAVKKNVIVSKKEYLNIEDENLVFCF